jgi:rhodanese-related sulfurtransferase
MENTKMLTFRMTACLALALLITAPQARAQDAAVEAMQEYLMFSEVTAGIILPSQIDKTVFDTALFIDTREEAQFTEATIPGAKHIEWREVLERLDEIPEDRMTILFCDTGVRSSQATFALRVAGRNNVVVMQSGFHGWQKDAAYKP